MGAPYEERFRTDVNDGISVVALWYGAPHNLWRIGVWGNDLDGELDNMTPDEADALARALHEAHSATTADV